jgi:DNA-binding transcriptional LysR family regulator
MDITRIDLNLLVTLEALLAERNVTRAAARLHLSQPAVSAQLNRLRDLFGDPLLVPAHRGMTPTTKAEELIDPLRLALDQLRNTLQSHRVFAPERARFDVAVACTDYLQAAIVIPLALALRTQAPGVRIAVRQLDPARLDIQLANGDIDLAFALPKTDAPQLRTTILFEESYVLIGRRGHPFLKPGLNVEDFVRLEHVVVSPSGGVFSTPVDDALAALGHKRKVVLSAASFLFVAEIAAVSDLVALVPRRLLGSQAERLTLIELSWLAERFSVAMIWRERTHMHPGHRWIRDLTAQLFAAPDR